MLHNDCKPEDVKVIADPISRKMVAALFFYPMSDIVAFHKIVSRFYVGSFEFLPALGV
ncbi:hypothetical protein D3OALGA1CA_5461 [Olavius algarvensis associated proteobacterium Delta 3]|nr:hypothetical protein D3OALGB2SA_3753 [Olavius algarvensis associated proteobacterium Delta 3]CAB5167227.1 hypothetical protein D3OALGA1CA_5461 [Olavius algarvensis associated proteobacterium Delta 3]